MWAIKWSEMFKMTAACCFYKTSQVCVEYDFKHVLRDWIMERNHGQCWPIQRFECTVFEEEELASWPSLLHESDTMQSLHNHYPPYTCLPKLCYIMLNGTWCYNTRCHIFFDLILNSHSPFLLNSRYTKQFSNFCWKFPFTFSTKMPSKVLTSWAVVEDLGLLSPYPWWTNDKVQWAPDFITTANTPVNIIVPFLEQRRVFCNDQVSTDVSCLTNSPNVGEGPQLIVLSSAAITTLLFLLNVNN